MVAGAGWPYGFPAPTLTTATRGCTAARNGAVEAVPLPWCATLSTSTGPVEARPQQLRVDLLLRVAHQQQAPLAEPDVEHDRDVVDALAGVRRQARHGPARPASGR